MSSALHLSLLIGPVIPVAAPAFMIDALDHVEVTSAAGQVSGFQLRFKVTSKSELNTIFLIAGAQNSGPYTPPLRVVLIVTLGGRPEPLFDGVMTNIEVQAGQQGQPGSITITGEDLTRVMDLIDYSGTPLPMPIPARVALLCSKYAAFGLLPLAIPELFPDAPIPVERIPSQQGSDLAYIRRLAEQVGYVFYIEPGPEPLTNVAYFGPEIKVGPPQPALNIDMDSFTNVESLNFSFDPTKGVLPIVFIQNQITRVPIPIPIPDLNPLQPPLGVISTPLANIKMMKDTASMNPMQAISAGLNEAKKSQDAVTASGSLSVMRYGRMLKARRLVGVRGAGIAYDGLYYVSKVTSTIERGKFEQQFDLTRNGLVSITPRVPV
ncbi:hypothetical protein [Nitrogeniibacter aestuarii]|uniref:hypothetical protein n=1 Tax=Nitrogeniibacter aestuarii TaxID=2815343 RepID=UPI001D12D188|nr:hypothetical protein [Nitrogeniibacter aestuarii]